MKTARAALLVLMLGGGIAVAEEYKHGSLVIGDPWSRATPKGAGVAVGYLTITNNGSAVDRLVGASAPFAQRAEIHEMKVEGGVMSMRALAGGIEIKPGEAIELKPGSIHLMFISPSEPLRAGQSVKGTLVFEKAGPIEVEFEVEQIGGSPEDRSAPHHRQ